MRFRYFDSDGTEVELSSVDALEFRIGTGAVTPETLLYDTTVGKWAPAHRHAVFRFLVERDDDLLPEESRAMWEEAGDEPVIGRAGPDRPDATPESAGEVDTGVGGESPPVADPPSPSPSQPEERSGEAPSQPAGDAPEPVQPSSPTSEEASPPAEEATSPAEEATSPAEGTSPPAEHASPSEEDLDVEEIMPAPWWGKEGGSSAPEEETGTAPASPTPQGGAVPGGEEESETGDTDTGWIQELGASTGLFSRETGPEGTERRGGGPGKSGWKDEDQESSRSPDRRKRRPVRAGSDTARKTRLRVLFLLLVLFGEVLIAGDLVEPGFDALAANGAEMKDLGDAGVQALREATFRTDAAPSSSPAAAADSAAGREEGPPGDEGPSASGNSPAESGPEQARPDPSAAAGPAPLGEEELERLTMEVSGAAFGDLADSMADLQDELGVEERPPSVWLDGAYLANADMYPEVGEYWRRYGSWVSSVRALEEQLFRGFVQNRVLKMGLDTARAATLSARTLERYGRSAEQREQLFDDLAALADEATALHETLAERTDAISHEPFTGEGLSRDPVIEAVADDPELAEDIWSRLDRIFVLLERIQGIRPVSTFRLQEALLDGLEVPEHGN